MDVKTATMDDKTASLFNNTVTLINVLVTVKSAQPDNVKEADGRSASFVLIRYY